MTLFEWFLSLPLWIRIVVLIPVSISAIEWIIMPFKINIWYNRYKDTLNKINIWYNRYKDTLKFLEAILEASKANREEFNSNAKIVSLLLKMLNAKKEEKNIKDV